MSRLMIALAVILPCLGACGWLGSNPCDGAGDPVALAQALADAGTDLEVTVILEVPARGGCGAATANATFADVDDTIAAVNITSAGSEDPAALARRHRRNWESITDGEQRDERARSLGKQLTAQGLSAVAVRCSDAERTCRSWGTHGEWVLDVQTLNLGLIVDYPNNIEAADRLMIAVAEAFVVSLDGSSA